MLCCGGGKPKDTEDKFKILENRWIIDKEAIGEGGFGTVHLCKSVKTGKQRACKAMRLPTMMDRDDFRHEVNILKKIRQHKNICHLVDHAEDFKFGYLVMQSCSGGELFDRIAEKKCTEADAARAVLDALSGLDFMHARRILHRDLKPENLLYKDKGPGAPLKLIDFGLAIQLPQNGRATEVCGTTSYMSPEVLQGNYSMECDIWSLGVITYFMLSGTLPFPGKSDDEKEALIEKGAFSTEGRRWEGVSKNAVDFVRKMLVQNPKKRLTSKLAMSHPWITQRVAHSNAPLSEEVAGSLKKYTDANRFEKAIRHQMATTMTTSELHRLRNMFEKLDTEGTGSVAINELQQVLQTDAADDKAKATLAKLDLSAFDLDGNGQIDWQEFVAGAMTEHDLYNDENLDRVFAKLDVNSDGTLCQREVASLLGDDHAFTRELLQTVQQKREDSSDATELHMTLDEFKALMMKSSTLEGGVSKKTKTRGRKPRSPKEVRA